MHASLLVSDWLMRETMISSVQLFSCFVPEIMEEYSGLALPISDPSLRHSLQTDESQLTRQPSTLLRQPFQGCLPNLTFLSQPPSRGCVWQAGKSMWVHLESLISVTGILGCSRPRRRIPYNLVSMHTHTNLTTM